MIQANELRLGNCIYISSQCAKITSISQGGVSADSENNSYVYEEFEDILPIPLTEEWLLKFRLIPTHGSIRKRDVPTFNNNSHIVFLEYHLKGWYMITPHIQSEIQYVHQLQNIYFSVTGEELEIAQPI